MKKQVFALILCLLFFSTKASVSLATPVINEFSASDSNDWIEIYNSGNESIDLSKYRFRDQTANNKLDLSGSLDPSGFVTFDWSNKLNNGGDLIKLVLATDESIADQVTYGDQGGIVAPNIGQTAGRKRDGESEWVIFTSSSRNLTNNSSSVIVPSSPTPSKTPTPTKLPTPTKIPTLAKIATAVKTNSTETKTPAPKSDPNIHITSSKNSNINVPSTKRANFAKISDHSSRSGQFAVIKKITEDKNNEQIKVLGAKDSDFSYLPLGFGLILIFTAIVWLVIKNNEQILKWIRK